MEVFLRNLPPDTTDRGLQKQLQHCMECLSITDYLAEKQRGKTIGHLTFLREADGKRFLQHHGEEVLPSSHFAQPLCQGFSNNRPATRHPPSRARLRIMGKYVFAKLSNRKPDKLTLKTIKHEASQRGHAEAPAEHVRPLHAAELSCGYHAFIDGKLIFVAEWIAHELCVVKFAKRCLFMELTQQKVKLRIALQSIIELIWWQDGSAAVTLSVAPTFLDTSTNDEIDSLIAALALGFAQPSNQRRPSQHQRLEAIDEDHAKISRFCMVYYFKVPNAITRHVNTDFQNEISRMRHRDIIPMTRYHLGFRYASSPCFSDALVSLRNQLANYNSDGSLPFGLLFLLQALVANSYLPPATVSALAQELAKRFTRTKKAETGRDPISVDAFKKLFDWIDYPSPLERRYMVRSKVAKETQDRALIFRAMVTPTRVLLLGPELEPMNRVLRKFSDHSYFIRAQFCDEDGQDLFYNAKISLDTVYQRFKSVLTNGIQVAGRVYKLLAWLSAPFLHGNDFVFPDQIITGLGDFSQLYSPARRAARIGQAFSDTPWAVDLDEHHIQVQQIPDVERNGRVFSDGVGIISLGALEAVHSVLPKSKGTPTCLQIRFAGAKGMLAVDPSLKGNQICIRPSMVKFKSTDMQLEICDVASKPIPMVLNRQLIKILEDMGAPRNWFLELQSREVSRLCGITSSVYNTASFVKIQSIGESIQLHKFLRQTEAMGVDYRRDRFLRGAIEAILLRELRLLKHKARIPVKHGMTLFGIMDETGYLEEGEVYVTYDRGDRHAEPPGPCKVIVTRSPALHPGDVQLAYNNIPPDDHPLCQRRNCVVFSRLGARDLPSQLSGGDLDGDVFHIIWDSEVVDTVQTFEPASYARVSPLELDRPVESADMAAFFVDFMKTDHLGVIATRHMILADQKECGTLDQNCIKLAELHSSAVDFSKSGRPVELTHLPRSDKWRPDFLARGPQITIHERSEIEMNSSIACQDEEDDEDSEEGPRHRFYASEKILGELYRSVDEQRIWATDIKMVIAAEGLSFWDQMQTALIERVHAIGPVNYEEAIHGAMINGAEHPHQPLRELEVFVGFIMNKSGVQTTRQRDRSVKLKEEFERITTNIMREMRHPTPVSDSVSNGKTGGELGALELCLACLYEGCRKEQREMRPSQRSSAEDIESFKVVAAASLMRELAIKEREMFGQAYAFGVGGSVGVGGRTGGKIDASGVDLDARSEVMAQNGIEQLNGSRNITL
ncbi:hypothetical protein N0V88_007127 [Collariella sp. IMI 366227]|nr:hypothetical protein N0V88_007127 [Collariella sp. IMI 366227]